MRLKITIWGENWCDEDFTISEIQGMSLDSVLDFKKHFEEDIADEDFINNYREGYLVVEPRYISAQIGNYPPPNVEVEGHWNFAIVDFIKFDYQDAEYIEDIW